MKNFVIFFLLLFLLNRNIISFAQSQQSPPPSPRINAGLITAHYSFDIPYSDLAERFGYNSEVGCGFYYKFKNNWLAGIDATFLFGETVNEDGILDSIKTSNGFIIGTDGYFANIQMYERGFRLPMIKAGKIFTLPKKFSNSGVFLLGGAGFIQHKIQIEDVSKTAVQLSEEYRKGYDRLTQGPIFSISAGYLFLEPTQWFSFFSGIELAVGLTHSARDYNYDTREKDTRQRKDILLGFFAGFCVPIYGKSDEQYYIY